ncbi:hypothetical protein C8J57DRAFT_1464865 [Mycena rebaudengoi]|nr:hypothetical protein C8J57DRAFT_1464865 [Mycena rebaudengoi]
MPRKTLPRELCDSIVDQLHAEPAALGNCALVCRAWVPSSRFHLFESISLTQHSGSRAARLNTLLANPHATIQPAVRTLILLNALSSVQIRNSTTGSAQVRTLLQIVPHITQLHNIRTLTLSDLPFDIFSAFPKVKMLSLHDVAAGPALLRLATYFPRLTDLKLNYVHAIPYRSRSPPAPDPVPVLAALRSLFVQGSSIGFFGWMGILAPNVTALSIEDISSSELPYLVKYLDIVGSTLETLRLGFTRVEDTRKFGWDELVPALGPATRLIVGFNATNAEDEPDFDASFLRTQLAEWDARGLLDIKRVEASSDTEN